MIEPTAAETHALEAVIDLALARHQETGGVVFTAAVLQGDRILALEANEVSTTCDPSRHAEIVAIARAAEARGDTDLSGATLIASMQPCEMCLAAMRWAGIDRLLFAMTQDEAPAFFQFPAFSIADFAAASKEPFHWRGGLGQERVREIYR
ncbi:nucleoside deaminase [Litorisediminicola beolgyonensis]|uniref:Nucleoside deaminase n=1 Tax=Litorisediminicola beolgyonensis TaxID=1173614 RepID=A0ABW3ZJ40_9RHOB